MKNVYKKKKSSVITTAVWRPPESGPGEMYPKVIENMRDNNEIEWKYRAN